MPLKERLEELTGGSLRGRVLSEFDGAGSIDLISGQP